MAALKIHDRAKWHYESEDFPAKLDERQAFVHIGMYFGWLIERDLIDSEFGDDCAEDIAEFKSRKITGPEVFWRSDGVLADDVLNREGRQFTAWYFGAGTPKYYADYDDALGGNLPTLYHVKDTWRNYDRLRPILDARLDAWRKRTAKSKKKR
jgi:hypothetical protein